MQRISEKFRRSLLLSQREKRGLLVLVFLMLIAWLSPYLYEQIFRPNEAEITVFENKIRLIQLKYEKKSALKNSNNRNRSFEQFSFDPNLVGKTQMLKLGIPVYLAERIIKYRNAGGKFRKKVDIKKIYGMGEKLYLRLQGLIAIPKEAEDGNGTKSSNTISRAATIDINLADSIQLVGLRGIGPVYASRIIKYRNLVGGYYRLSQLIEVYGINDSIYRRLKSQLTISENFKPRKIRINRINGDSLRKHPYFRDYRFTNALINYRNQHGPFRDRDDLRNLYLITDSVVENISPYISFQ